MIDDFSRERNQRPLVFARQAPSNITCHAIIKLPGNKNPSDLGTKSPVWTLCIKSAMKIPVILCLAVFLSAPAGPATSQGLVLEDETYDALPQLAQLEGYKDQDLPPAVDLSAYCPPVRNQGDVYSCVGWAVGYGALTIKKAILAQCTDRKRIEEQANSAMFIYNQIKRESCAQGARISDALNLIREKGDCLASEFDTDVEDCERRPDETLLNRTALDTIADYLTLFGLQASAEEKIRRTIRALSGNEPVIIGMMVRKNFYQLHDAKYWWPNLGNTTPAGGHAMVVVGYDLPSASFLLFNSWGTVWGDRGFIRIKFEDFAEHCKYGFILKMGENARMGETINAQSASLHPVRTISGAASLDYLDGEEADGSPLFRRSAVTGTGNGVYRATGRDWQTGQLFQLAAWAEQHGLYLYVFSIDPTETIHVHWPRSFRVSDRFSGLNESALLLDPQARATIPGPDQALRLNQSGHNTLYLLFAAKEVKHLDFIAAKMRDCAGDYRERLESLLGKHLVPLADIRFEADRPAFTAATRSDGYMVPMVVVLNARN